MATLPKLVSKRGGTALAHARCHRIKRSSRPIATDSIGVFLLPLLFKSTEF